MTAHQPKRLALAHAGLRSDVAARALGAVEARRLTTLMADAEALALARIKAAQVEAAQILAAARAEAEAVLKLLPDFAAIEAAGKGAMRAIRDAADRHGIALAAVTGTSPNPVALAARNEAIAGIIRACPELTDHQVAKLFARVAAGRVATTRRRLGDDPWGVAK